VKDATCQVSHPQSLYCLHIICIYIFENQGIWIERIDNNAAKVVMGYESVVFGSQSVFYLLPRYVNVFVQKVLET
jgi:hypothetical protein